MTAGVVGPDQGPTPSDLSFRSLLQWRRERERERESKSLVYAFFFPHSTPQREQQNGKVSGVIVIFSVFAYALLSYVTTMNILCSFLAYSCVQSVNERKSEQYSARESVVVGADPTFYIRRNCSCNRHGDATYRSNCVAKTSRLAQKWNLEA